MIVGIIDVGISNIGSLRGALYNLGWDTKTVTVASDIVDTTHLILPGVGSFTEGMKRLRSAKLVDPIQRHATEGYPIMGICLGMQLLADFGVEGGQSEGLRLIPGEITPFDNSPSLRLPHVGWNVMNHQQKHPLLKGIRTEIDFYFVHSYFFKAKRIADIIGTTEYGLIYPSFIANDNIVGVQFHPEKSQRNGLTLLDNFCLWDGTC